MSWCEQQYTGLAPSQHGGLERDHIEALIAMGEIDRDEAVEFPFELGYIYDAFRKVRFSKVPKDDGFALYPRDSFSFAEIEAYNRMSGLDLQPWEIDAMMSINGIYERSTHGNG